MADSFIGMEEFKAKLLELYANLSGKDLHDALYAGAEVFRAAIQNAAPVGQAEYTYQYQGRTVRLKNPSGRMRDNVIIYQRRRRGSLMTQAEDLSLLIGFEKRHAFYAYFVEYGTKKQRAHPFMRAAYDSAQPAALEAVRVLLEGRVKGAA